MNIPSTKASPMTIEISLDGESVDAVVRDLRDWLRREDGVDIKLASTATIPGQLGGGLVTGLTLFFKAASAGKAVTESFMTWLRLRQPNIEFTLKKGRTVVTLKGNQPIDKALVDSLLRLGQGLTDV
jgi:hypothetical protein